MLVAERETALGATLFIYEARPRAMARGRGDRLVGQIKRRAEAAGVPVVGKVLHNGALIAITEATAAAMTALLRQGVREI